MSASIRSILCLLAVFVCGIDGRFGEISPYNVEQRNPLSRNFTYTTSYFIQQVDHFGFANSDTFKQRYLIADQFWNHNGGPIFFYTGNEGDITWFCNNTGFMWDIAPEFKALLIFAEHRYYGESLPYGPDSFKDPSKLNYLTSEQALADFAELVKYLKQTIPGAANSKVIAIGGSYGGMLAAWARMKYPNMFQGALAASAPIWLFDGLEECDGLYKTITKTFWKTSAECANNILHSWSTIDEIGKTGTGKSLISSTFHLCKPLTTDDDISQFKSWLSSVWFNLAMVDYPYPASFLEPLPAWPIKVVCSFLSTPLSDKALLTGLFKAVNVYFNYTGTAKCLNTSQTATGNLGNQGWNYQACTEMVMATCSGNDSMFEPQTWDFQKFSDGCYESLKVRPRRYWGITEYWGKNIEAASNIIFSNGLLDPWSSWGVLQSPSHTLIAIQIPDGAHHLDLRASDPQDPPDVKAARQQEKNIMKLWLYGN